MESYMKCPKCGSRKLRSRIEKVTGSTYGKEKEKEETYYVCIECGAQFRDLDEQIMEIERLESLVKMGPKYTILAFGMAIILGMMGLKAVSILFIIMGVAFPLLTPKLKEVIRKKWDEFEVFKAKVLETSYESYASAKEGLKSVEFRKQNENGGDSCLFCNYHHLSKDKIVDRCELYGVRFWNNFSAGDYVCSNFDGSILDSLLDGINEENQK